MAIDVFVYYSIVQLVHGFHDQQQYSSAAQQKEPTFKKYQLGANFEETFHINGCEGRGGG